MLKTNYVAEFRYIALPEMLDKRGVVVESMLGGDLDQWQITNNRVEVSNSDRTKTIFVGHANSGFITHHSDSVDSLMQTLAKGLKNLPEKKYKRIGFRLTCLTSTDKTFISLKKEFREKLMKAEFLKNSPIKTTLRDMAIIYELELKDGIRANIQVGPMEKTQAKDFFGELENLPKVGVFIDIDYNKIAGLEYSDKDIKRFIYNAKIETLKLKDHLIKTIGVEVNE